MDVIYQRHLLDRSLTTPARLAGSAMAGATNKRSREEAELDIGSPTLLTTAEDVMSHSSKVGFLRDQLLVSLGNAKGEAKETLRTTINGFFDAYLVLSNSFLFRLGQDNALESVKQSLDAVQSRAPTDSYANIAAHSVTKRSIFPDRIALDRGKPFPISSGTRIIIGPKEEAKTNFSSAKDTRDKFFRSVDPVKLQLKTKHVNFSTNNSIVLEADNANAETLRGCPELAEAGLEIKPDIKMNPRIIIHGIPVEYTSEEIMESLLQLNLPTFNRDDVKIVSLYPARQKKHRSCIVEIKPECRKVLEKNNSVYIKWLSCSFADHISVLQCFKCLQFGHKASECRNPARCSHCAGEHTSESCQSKEINRCHNCVLAKCQDFKHSAFDKSKCSLLRKRIERKARNISYG